MAEAALKQGRERRARGRAASRAAILDAARRVAARDGARDLSLRAVAAAAGFAPAALYGYFRNKDELLLALASEDLSAMARTMRDCSTLAGAAAAALELMHGAETMAAASGAFGGGGEAERLFNGRMIGALKALSDAGGLPANSRQSQCDIVLVAAALSGLALLSRSGRLEALGFSREDILARLDSRFSVKG
jgi:AcrR family transcriptional regulator